MGGRGGGGGGCGPPALPAPPLNHLACTLSLAGLLVHKELNSLEAQVFRMAINSISTNPIILPLTKVIPLLEVATNKYELLEKGKKLSMESRKVKFNITPQSRNGRKTRFRTCIYSGLFSTCS